MSDIDLDGPLRHLIRTPLPWRQPERTECGRPLNDVAVLITRDEARTLIARYGQKRAHFLLCLTCVNAADRTPEWKNDPVGRMVREAGPMFTRKDQDEGLLARELRAIAWLIEHHREEFDAAVEGQAEATNLAERRKPKRRA